MKRMKILMLLMFSCVCMAIASIDRPTQTNLDDLARGQPVVGVNVETVSAPMPTATETNRKTRDVDVKSYKISNYNKTIKSSSAGNKTSPDYSDRVGWKS